MTKLFDDAGLTTILILGTLVAVTALYYAIRATIRSRRRRYWGPMTITIEDPSGKKYSLRASDLGDQDLATLLTLLKSNSARHKPLSSEAGVVAVETLLMVVPAVIALLLVITIVIMSLLERDVKEHLVNSLAVIIGYYFGVGATRREGQAITPDQAQQLLLSTPPTTATPKEVPSQ
jgi:hypothetical protein